MVIKVSDKDALVSAKGRNIEIPLANISKVLLKKSPIDIIRLEKIIILYLECGRIVTMERIPSPKTGTLRDTLLKNRINLRECINDKWKFPLVIL